jgi:hypothetical protein
MKHTIWLSTLVTLILFTGGCNKQEAAPPAPKPEPVVAAQPEPTAQLQPPPVTTDTASPPSATINPPSPAPVKVVPVETEKVTPTTTVQPTPVAPVPETPAVQPTKTPAAAPQTVIYKATNGNVSFNHQQHASNNACSSCHPSEPAAKIVLGKDKAHLLCKGCHQEKKAGPTQCSGCHIKG